MPGDGLSYLAHALPISYQQGAGFCSLLCYCMTQLTGSYLFLCVSILRHKVGCLVSARLSSICAPYQTSEWVQDSSRIGKPAKCRRVDAIKSNHEENRTICGTRALMRLGRPDCAAPLHRISVEVSFLRHNPMSQHRNSRSFELSGQDVLTFLRSR